VRCCFHIGSGTADFVDAGFAVRNRRQQAPCNSPPPGRPAAVLDQHRDQTVQSCRIQHCGGFSACAVGTNGQQTEDQRPSRHRRVIDSLGARLSAPRRHPVGTAKARSP
jgi:hypothetical protein